MAAFTAELGGRIYWDFACESCGAKLKAGFWKLNVLEHPKNHCHLAGRKFKVTSFPKVVADVTCEEVSE